MMQSVLSRRRPTKRDQSFSAEGWDQYTLEARSPFNSSHTQLLPLSQDRHSSCVYVEALVFEISCLVGSFCSNTILKALHLGHFWIRLKPHSERMLDYRTDCKLCDNSCAGVRWVQYMKLGALEQVTLI